MIASHRTMIDFKRAFPMLTQRVGLSLLDGNPPAPQGLKQALDP